MKKVSTLIMLLVLVSCSGKNIDVEGRPVPDLRAWLASNPSVASAIKLEEDANPSYWFGGTLTELAYDDWSGSDKAALDDAFARSWQWIYSSNETTILGTEEFTMPLECTYCATRLQTVPNNGPFTIIPENLSKTVYIAQVAQSLALEIGGALGWSIATSSASELHHYFNSRSVMHRVGTGGIGDFFFGEPGGGGDARIKYLGRSTPATPIYAYRWMVNNNILQSTQQETIYAVLQWFRENGVHFYGSSTYTNHNDHWGYPGQTSAYLVMTGTVRATESTSQHWTAGCHGTAGFIKSVLKTVNIPMEIIYTCGHSQLYFPTLDMYVDHADNPYNSNVRTQSTKSISGILLDATTYTARFGSSPDYLPTGNAACSDIGKAATDF